MTVSLRFDTKQFKIFAKNMREALGQLHLANRRWKEVWRRIPRRQMGRHLGRAGLPRGFGLFIYF